MKVKFRQIFQDECVLYEKLFWKNISLPNFINDIFPKGLLVVIFNGILKHKRLGLG